MWTWSERPPAGARDPAVLTLEELARVRPHHVRGPFPPGRRAPLGERPGKGRSQSLDFDGIGPWTHGDDARWIDWRATARTGEVQVKRFAAQSHRARAIVLDLHEDLYFGTRVRPMAKTAALVAARLAWESLALNEPVGLVLPDGLGGALPARRGRGHALRLMAALARAYGRGATAPAGDFPALAARAAGLVGRGDEICAIGEFAEPLDPLLAATRDLSENRELRAWVVEDPMARRPLAAGRYPARRGVARDRRVFDIDARAARAAPEAAGALGRARRRRLIDGGWRVTEALGWLPEAGG